MACSRTPVFDSCSRSSSAASRLARLDGASDSGIGTGGSRNIGGSGRTSRMPVPRSHIQTHKAHMSTHLHTCT